MFALLTTAAVLSAQAPEPPIAETRLSVHTLLREDVFAGFLDDNMARVARAEQNIALLLQQRPAERGNLLAWRGGINVQHAVRAHEAGKATSSPGASPPRARTARRGEGDVRNGGVRRSSVAATRSSGSAAAGTSRRGVVAGLRCVCRPWKQQAAQVEKSRCTSRVSCFGEAQSAHRTGRAASRRSSSTGILTLLPKTPFEETATVEGGSGAAATTT